MIINAHNTPKSAITTQKPDSFNKVLNVFCTFMSLLVFLLGLLSMYASFVGATEEEGLDLNSLNFMREYGLPEDYYTNSDITENSGIPDLSFPVQDDGTYGEEAIKQAMGLIATELERAEKHDGFSYALECYANMSATVKELNVSGKHVNYYYLERDMQGNTYSEDGYKGITNTGFENNSISRQSIINGNVKRQVSNKVSLNGNKVVGNFDNAKETKSVVSSKDSYPKVLAFPLVYNYMNKEGCFLTKSGSGYKLILSVGRRALVSNEKSIIDGAKERGEDVINVAFTKYFCTIAFTKKGEITMVNVNNEVSFRAAAPFLPTRVTIQNAYNSTATFKYLKPDFNVREI